MLILTPHGFLVPIIVKFEHFELGPIQILGIGTGSFNPPKRLTAQHWS
jgi:hypothetical protein